MSVGAVPPRQQLVTVFRQWQSPASRTAARAAQFPVPRAIFAQKCADYITRFLRQHGTNAIKKAPRRVSEAATDFVSIPPAAPQSVEYPSRGAGA